MSVRKKYYVSEQHPLIRTLKNIYEEETGFDATPISSGRATYARVFENFAAFGPVFPEGNKWRIKPMNIFESMI